MNGFSLFFLLLTAVDGQVDSAAVMDSLRKLDAVYESALSLSGVEHCDPDFMRPGDPAGDFEWRYTRSGDEMVLRRSRVNVAVPFFVPEGESQFADYDKDGNLTVRVLVEETHHVSPEERFRLLKYIQYAVAPDGSVQSEEPYDSVSFFGADDPEPSLAIKRTLWSSGRGFSSFLDEIVQCTSRNDGRIEVIANGFESPASYGVWKLVVDPAHSYLVTEAQYIRNGRSDPSIKLRNEGAVGTDTCEVGGKADWSVNVGFTSHQVADCEVAEFRVDEELLRIGRGAKQGPFSGNAVGFDKRSGSYQSLDLRPHDTRSKALPPPETSSRTKIFLFVLNAQILLGLVGYWCYGRYRRSASGRKVA